MYLEQDIERPMEKSKEQTPLLAASGGTSGQLRFSPPAAARKSAVATAQKKVEVGGLEGKELMMGMKRT